VVLMNLLSEPERISARVESGTARALSSSGSARDSQRTDRHGDHGERVCGLSILSLIALAKMLSPVEGRDAPPSYSSLHPGRAPAASIGVAGLRACLRLRYAARTSSSE